MNLPDPSNGEKFSEPTSSSEESRRRVLRAAALRPINLLMLVLGAFAGAFFSWWFLPLTVVTYALLVFLATRDPFFERKTLGQSHSTAATQPSLDISLERRARWLPKGETRNTVDNALEAYRKSVASIEGASDVTRTVLEDAVPKLHTAADRLVETATKREKAATIIAELKSLTNTREDHLTAIEKLENEMQAADAEISKTYDQLVALRAKVAHISIADAPETRAEASQINASLDELNLRLEALEATMTSSEENLSPPRNQLEQDS
ncbi:MAG: hypothetical protein WA982_13375 [Rubrobacteraceae bacterium]